jgi:hypothetical protein
MPTHIDTDLEAEVYDPLSILHRGVTIWNQWRDSNQIEILDLTHADLSGENLTGVNFRGVNLSDASLSGSDLSGANLSRAVLNRTNLVSARLRGASLIEASLVNAKLNHADLRWSIFSEVNLNGADLGYASLNNAIFVDVTFKETNLSNAVLYSTLFARTDLSEVKGLSTVAVSDEKPPSIGLDVIKRSKGNIPGKLLRAAGLADNLLGILYKQETYGVEVNELLLTDRKLTPRFLLNILSPFLCAIEEIHFILNEIKTLPKQEIAIKTISQNSPISISFNGGADVIQQIKEIVVPSRRKHAEKIARLLEKEKRAEIKKKEAEHLEIEARAAKDQAEAQRTQAEAAKLRAEAERISLENEKLRMELHEQTIQLAIRMLGQVAPNLSEVEKIAYVVKLLPPIDSLMFSDLELPSSNEDG